MKVRFQSSFKSRTERICRGRREAREDFSFSAEERKEGDGVQGGENQECSLDMLSWE